jgi:hypothetical protein
VKKRKKKRGPSTAVTFQKSLEHMVRLIERVNDRGGFLALVEKWESVGHIAHDEMDYTGLIISEVTRWHSLLKERGHRRKVTG